MPNSEAVLCEFHKIPVTYHHVERIGNCTIGFYKCKVCEAMSDLIESETKE